MYTWNFDGDAEWCQNASFETVDECIEDATYQHPDEDYETVYVGECVPFVPTVMAADVLDSLQGDAGDFAGEIGDEWSAYTWKNKEELNELSDALTSVVHEWMRKYGYYPNFYAIQNIREYPMRTTKEKFGEVKK